MEFALICPTDGRIELGLEDITSVVIRDNESVEVAFACPRCGTSLRAMLQVPNVLAAAMELERFVQEFISVRGAMDVQSSNTEAHDATHAEESVTADAGPEASEAALREARERAGEPYCEYFRRQLARVDSVEDLLQEID